MTLDQAAQLRAMVSESDYELPRAQAHVLAITSGKGGVGKTNIAVNLATHLASEGVKVALFDADLALANADVVAGLRCEANLAHVLAGRRKIDEVLVKGPGGFTLLPGASGLSQMANLDQQTRTLAIDLMQQLENDHDLLIVDTGAGINPTVCSFLLAADDIMVVTTPEPTAVTDAYALMKVLWRGDQSLPVRLMVNMAQDQEEALRVYRKMDQVTQHFLAQSIEFAGWLKDDAVIPQGVRQRMPFILQHPKSQQAESLRKIARTLCERGEVTQPRAGFFQRVTHWLKG